MTTQIKKRAQTGLTLIEVLIAGFVLTVGIASTLLFFSHAMISTQLAGDMTLATSHAEYILEEMQTRDTLSNIALTNWPQWASDEGLNMLPNETFTVTFLNPSKNPLDVNVVVSWVRNSRPLNATLTTAITR